MINECYIGDCIDGLRQFKESGLRARTCVTSPPYWGLRDYGHEGAYGLEDTLDEWVDRMVSVCAAVRDVLTDDGTLWLNLGDSYSGSGKGGNPGDSEHQKQRTNSGSLSVRGVKRDAYKPKDLIGQPWAVAFALRADGWYLRQDIIWHKPNPMPESVRDRCTKAHEYIFLLSKSNRYFYDFDAVKEPVTGNAHSRGNGVNKKIKDTKAHARRKTNEPGAKFPRMQTRPKQNKSFSSAINGLVDSRNMRSVWTVPTQPYSAAHFATFPSALIEPCILAGSEIGDIVLDPFMGSGTTAQVAEHLGRKWFGCEINPEYVSLQRDRLRQQSMSYEYS